MFGQISFSFSSSIRICTDNKGRWSNPKQDFQANNQGIISWNSIRNEHTSFSKNNNTSLATDTATLSSLIPNILILRGHWTIFATKTHTAGDFRYFFLFIAVFFFFCSFVYTCWIQWARRFVRIVRRTFCTYFNTAAYFVCESLLRV